MSRVQHPSGRRRPVRNGIGAVLAVALAALTLLGQTTPAAAAEEVYGVPSSGYWDVTGHGWGHGIGMSQWGSQGAAQQGRTAEQILAFYYPGTTSNNVGNPQIRVQLRALSAVASGSTYSTPPGQNEMRIGNPATPERHPAGRYTVTVTGSGFVVARRATVSGPILESRTYTGSELIFSTGDGVVASGSQGSATGTWYRGYIRIVRTGSTLDVINNVPLQEYLYGVVPRESPASWLPAALQAQSVAARSYALSVRQVTGPYDLCDTTACQVYGGRALVSSGGAVTEGREHANTNQAVNVTSGLVRWYAGAVAFTQFSSSNGGYSRAGSRPYLTARADPYSGTASGDTVSNWTNRLQVSTVAAYCPSGGSLQRLVIVSRDGNGDLGGRITSARVECSTGNRTLTTTGELSFGMRSHWWRPNAPAFGFFLSNTFGAEADTVFALGAGTETALVGDWDGDGIDTIALRRGNLYYIRNSNSAGPFDRVIVYGRADDVVLVGDWDGNGTDTLGVRRGNIYHLRNTLSSGVADRTIAYGRNSDAILIGDWDGNGTDTLAVRRGNLYYLRNSLTSGEADRTIAYGRNTDIVLTGDWDGNGTDTLAVRRGNIYYLRNSLTSGEADRTIAYGRASDVILIGDWDGNRTDTLGVHRKR
ncbi:SpoIID/LytB domain-containing protein [Occultella kanbiaonis]|uniref:SpoIID/LytB domain-containing protein n=1 Tax=Occultella kanbiaonis TaxID=2675754 RepID=UPI00143DD9B4|nr:SpoIID/LytB domain-containing protein [Occultella kanbiaonis]